MAREAKDVRSFIGGKIWDVKQRIEANTKEAKELNDEKEILEGAMDLLNPCPDCRGLGKIRHFYAHNYTPLEPCETCNGTGDRQK